MLHVHSLESGSTGTSLEAFISFHENLLSFFEDFVVHCRVPLLPLLQPILWKMSVQVSYISTMYSLVRAGVFCCCCVPIGGWRSIHTIRVQIYFTVLYAF